MPGRPLSIALFSDSALPILNGVSVSIDGLMKGLREQGHSVHLFCSGFPGHHEQDPNVHRFGALLTPFAKGYPLSVPPFYPMLREFRKHRFDVIHTHTPFTVGMVGLRWAESHEIPIVSTYHTLYDKYAHYIPVLPKRYTRYKIAKHTNFYYNNVDQVITPSDASSRWLQRHNIRTPISVVPTGIPVAKSLNQASIRAELGARPEQKVMLYVGRIAVEKNLSLLFQAAAQVMRDDPRTLLWVVGDGPARETYRRMASDLGIGDRCRFFGFVPREKVDPYLAAADLFVFPSMTETQGLVVMEAMSYGLPSVVVQAGGAGDAVSDGRNGLLVSNDSAMMSGAIKRLLSDESLYNHLSEHATIDAREYSLPNMVRRITDIYHAAMGEPASVRAGIHVL